MTNKNKKDFFSELEKELPFSPYGERFKEELTEHLEDSTEDYIKKGAGLEKAANEALNSLGKSKILSQTYTKYLRPDLFLRFYFEAALVGVIAAILTVSYLFFSISGPPNDYYGNGIIDILFFWTLKRILPFLLFFIFYLITIKNTVRMTAGILRIWNVLIIMVTPCIVLGIWLTNMAGDRYLILEVAKVLLVNYIACAFATYILIRNSLKLPSLLTKIWRHLYDIVATLVIFFIFVGSFILQFYLKMPYQYQYPYMGEPILLRPLVAIELFTKTLLGIDLYNQSDIKMVWLYGIVLIIIGILCLADILLYFYKIRKNFNTKFSWFKLIILTFIASVLLVNPEASYKPRIIWYKPSTNITNLIEERETGPFHNLYLRWFKVSNALYTISNTRLIEDGFAIDKFYTEQHFEQKQFFSRDSYRTIAIENIQSINNFIITSKPADQTSFSLESLNPQLQILPDGFICDRYAGKYNKVIAPYVGNQIAEECVTLTYKDAPIFSGNTPGNTLISIKVNPQNKWALLHFPDSAYLVSLK